MINGFSFFASEYADYECTEAILPSLIMYFFSKLPQVEPHDFIIKHGIMDSQAAEERKCLEGFDIARVERPLVSFVRHLSNPDH